MDVFFISFFFKSKGNVTDPTKKDHDSLNLVNTTKTESISNQKQVQSTAPFFKTQNTCSKTRYILKCVCPALEIVCIKYFKILHTNKSEVLMDQLSNTLTRVNVSLVISFIYDLWQVKEKKLCCKSLCITLLCLFIVSITKHICSVFIYYMFKVTCKSI